MIFKPRTSLILLLVLLMSTACFAATVGKIAGKVTDKETGEPIPGVAVQITGTTMGALTDVDGKYFILNVPVDEYTVRAEQIGYAPVELQGVKVSVDLTTNADFQLSSKVLDIGETQVVTAERPLVIKDQTQSLDIKTKEEVQNLPTRGYQDVVGLSAGVVNFQSNTTTAVRGGGEQTNTPQLNIRGGRSGEVAYIVDGVATQDPLTNVSTTAINNNAIEEISIQTGGFSAEYGWISSGIINVTTRDGADKYSGSVEGITDEFLGSSAGYHWNTVAANLDGPLFGDKATFFVAGERRRFGDREAHATTENALMNVLSNDLATARLPNNDLSGWNWQGKLRYDINQKNILRLGSLGSYEDWDQFHMNYFFNGAHGPRYRDENYSVYGRWTSNVSPTTFFEVGSNYQLTKRLAGDKTHFDNLLAYGRPNGNSNFDDTRLFWKGDDPTTPDVDEGHVYEDYLKRYSSHVDLNFNLTSQINDVNELKVGSEFVRHTLRQYHHLDPTQIDSTITDPVQYARSAWQDADFYGYDETGQNEVNGGRDGAKHPYTFALFFQDKVEWEGLVVNAGLRYDLLNVNSDRLRNEERPLDPDNVLANPSAHTDQEIANATILDDGDFESASAEQKISPRVGVGFPISDRTVFHINYGKFFQRPELQNLYVGTQFLERMVGDAPYYSPVGNPNLEPEQTTAYEVGLQHQLGDYTSFNATAYYKDVKGLTQVVNQPSSPNAFASYRNSDFGTIKGFDFQLKMRRNKSIQAELDYSLSWADGTGSFANTQSNIAWTNTERPIRVSPLEFDQRHKITAIMDIRAGREQGPKLGDIYPFQNAGVNFVFSAASGTPYTPSQVYDEVTIASVTPIIIGKINSRNGPWTYRLDMKANKTFSFARMNWDLYLWVLNVLDTENAIDVYEGTGEANNTGWLATAPGEQFAQTFGQDGVDKYNLKQQTPLNYDTPRQVRLGLRLMF